MRKELLLTVFCAFTVVACNAVDRAGIVCMDEPRAMTEELVVDCQAGVQIADETAVHFARSHRLLPIALVPDNDEIAGARADAYSKCVTHVATPENPELETRRQLACEAGIEAYIRQIRYMNRPVGQEY